MKNSRPEPRHHYPALEAYRKELSRCVKCGSCSAVCPSYLYERDESFSARGRMSLIKAVLDGRLSFSEIFKDRLSTCTTCLACEAACPSNVPVTEIIQAVKELAVAESGMGMINSIIATLVKRPALFRATAWLAPAVLHYSKNPVAQGHREGSTFNVRDSTETTKRGRVAFFPGCAIKHFRPDIGKAAHRVLTAIGCDVIIPEGLKCCGRPLLSLGDRKKAEELAAHNAALFEALEVDAIVTACASCGLTFKTDYPKLLQSGATKPAVLDIHDFLSGRIAGIHLNPVRKSVTIHDPCHLGRGQGLSRTVRDVLQAIPGISIVEMKDQDRCCGFGGVMRITHRELSDGIVESKVKNILASGASTVATGCPGCCMQITDALRRQSSEIDVLHPVQLLEEAFTNAEVVSPGTLVKEPGSGKSRMRKGRT
jgi:glycolate oxidase iron-sulfur subunit